MPDLYPPDYTTAVGQVRSLIPDVEQLGNPNDPDAAATYLFSDDILANYVNLALENSVKRAAAMALEVMGSSELFILKVITQNDLATNGALVAAQWGARAVRLRAEADADDSTDVASFVLRGPYQREPLFDAEAAAKAGPYYPWPVRSRLGI